MTLGPLIDAARIELSQGRLEAADALLRRAPWDESGYAEICHLRGLVAFRSGRLDAAARLIAYALAQDPWRPDMHGNLGVVRQKQGHREVAGECYRRALQLDPHFADALSNLSTLRSEEGRWAEAVACCQAQLVILPQSAKANFNLGTALDGSRCPEKAALSYRRTLAIDPGHVAAAANLGSILNSQGRLGEASFELRKALALEPAGPLLLAALGRSFQDQARISQAIRCFRRALRVKPDFFRAFSNLLYSCQFADDLSADESLAYVRAQSARSGPSQEAVSFRNDRQEARRLRVGYVSADFREHSVAYFLQPLFQYHDRAQVEIFCYSGVAAPDAMTRQLKALSDHWRDVGDAVDAELLELIKRDRIDILVDLSGYTHGNRIPVFARRAAPIQVTWLGYPGTTGVEAMDYRLVDEITDPEGQSEAQASEVLVRMPDGFLCYQPPDRAPEVKRRPVGRSVTFGSFNNPAKLSGDILDLWGEILCRLPDARLLLKGHAFADEGICELFRRGFADRGIAADRLQLIGRLPVAMEHLAFYGEVDIALDPTPYNGTTTTCEALWMGVPVITLRGDRHASRVGASLLTTIGLPELVASNRREYVELAVRLARSPERLAVLSGELRPRMQASPLCDGQGFSRKMEAAYRKMWRKWCGTTPAGSSRAC